MLRRLESITYTLFLFLTPLLVTSFSKELFEFPKTNFLYLMTGIVILISLWNFKLNINVFNLNTKQKLLLGSLVLIFVSNLISFLFSVDYYTSLFGYYTRFNGGLISILCLIIWALLFANKNFDRAKVERLLLLILLSGVIVAVYAILQKFGIDKNLWSEDSTQRVFSTLGQPNWLAAYLIPIFYLALYFGPKFKSYIIVGLVPAALVYFAVLFTYSISGIFAFLTSIIIYGILNSKQIKNFIKKYWHTLLILLLLSTALAIPLGNRIAEQVENMSGIVGLLQTEDSQNQKANYGDTGKIRLILWQGTLNLITSSPKQFLIGSGPETFTYVFPRFRPDSINATSEAGFVHNKPHNWYLEIFANLGLLGLASYLIFICGNIYLFIKSEKTHLSNILFCGWISILITNFFGWPTVPLSILFFIIPIFMNYDLFRQKDSHKTTQENQFSFIKLFPLFLVANFLILSSLILTVADYYYKNNDFTTAHKINPLEPRYELFEIIYGKEFDSKVLVNFYIKERNNPYIVKTIVNYLDQISKMNIESKKVSDLRIEIMKDAAKNSPNDLQFRN